MVRELPEDRRQKELTDLEPLIRLRRQLDELEHTVWLIGEACKCGTARGPHRRDVMSQPAHLILHQLTILGTEPILVPVEQVAELDVVKARVVALRACGQEDADRTVRGTPQPRRKQKQRQ